MAAAEPIHSGPGIFSPRQLAEQAFSRAAGAPLVLGNQVRILKNAQENYPAWLAAMERAKRNIHFESYIIQDDPIGRRFADALIRKARQGVRVRVIYDWFGTRGILSRRFWRRLRDGGVEVRCFNPPRPDNPLVWLSRDHRKLIVVDDEVAFVGGLCVSEQWVGNPARGIEPWRDTAVELRGPAVCDLEWCFADMWKTAGGPAVADEDFPLSDCRELPAAGSVSLRVVATNPNMGRMYRLEQLMAALARRSIWMTDAYFVATTTFLQSLCSAAMDGVDVRLLVPRVSDVPLVRSLSRAGYRPLLEAGVRVFEWNGTMLHAKTAVVDGRWSRVGSSNLNLSSWIGNWELDVMIEDSAFAQAMERMYLEDLSHSTEIVLENERRVRPIERPQRRGRRILGQGSAGRAASGVLAITNTIGAVITRRQTLGPAEARLMFSAGLVLLSLAAIGWLWPLFLIVPLEIAAVWFGLDLLLKAYKLWRTSRLSEASIAQTGEKPGPNQPPRGCSPQAGANLNSKESQLQSKR